MKTCIKCGVEKPLEDFYKRSSSPDVHRRECKSCVIAQTNEYRKNNKERSNQYSKAYRERHPDRWKEISKNNTKKQYAKNPERWKSYARDWRQANMNRVKETNAAWKEKNPNWWSEYREKNADSLRKKNSFYAKNNRAKCAQRSSRYNARKLRAQSVWLSIFQLAEIEAMYDVAAACKVQTGIPHDVDHIVPLQGKTVCGLHVPWNLQVIPAIHNKIKSNRHPDEWEAMSGRW